MSIVEIALGAVIAILITITTENLRKPKLEFELAPPTDIEYTNRPANRVRFLGLGVRNKPLPILFQWMSRNAALQCHGVITFHHLDGQNVFGRSMPIRWSGSPEPVGMPVEVGGTRVVIFDPSIITLSPRMDVYPGEVERLDIAAKFDDDGECYGWSNESYFSDPVWKNPNWKLLPGRYLVKVAITSSGEKISGTYRLINDVGRQDFRLAPPMKGDVIPE
jgi:hypothetical protein